MSKKLDIVIGTVCVVLLVVAMLAYATILDTEEEFEYTETANEITITNYLGSSDNVIIPIQINGKLVTTIEDRAFIVDKITLITVPDSVTKIGDNAFNVNVTLIIQGLEDSIIGANWGAASVEWLGENTSPMNEDFLNFDMNLQSEFVWHIALINLTDNNLYDESSISHFNTMFNENDSSNDFLSVYEYFDIASRGKLQVSCNIAIYDSNYSTADFDGKKSDYYFENDLFSEAVKYGEVHVNKGMYHAGSLIIPLPADYSDDAMLWPHAWIDENITLFPEDYTFQPVLFHELAHVFGLRDLYDDVPDETAVSSFDLMGSSVFKMYSSINAYHREQLSWLDSSDYGDATNSGIEEISKSDRYTLNPSTAQEGTIAYKFGEKGTESFMIEYRHASGKGIDNILSNDNESGLLIYRVNTEFKGNLSGTYYEIFMFREGTLGEDQNYLFSEGEQYGMLADSVNYDYLDSIYYSNKTNSQVLVDNIEFNIDGTISFDIDFENM